MAKELSKEELKIKYGYNEQMKNLFYETHPELPNGSFQVMSRGDNHYWYFLLSSAIGRGNYRLKYMTKCFEGVNNDGNTSFVVCLKAFHRKNSSDFKPEVTDGMRISTLMDEFMGVLIEEEKSDEGRKLETTQSLLNSCRRFRDFSLEKDLRLIDIKSGYRLKKHTINFIEHLKSRDLKRNTIRTYLKGLKQFLNWASDEDIGKGIIQSHPITNDFIKKIYPPSRRESKGIGERNVYYNDEHFQKMWDECRIKVRDLWNDFCKSGWSRKHTNQPFGVASDITYFVSLFQIHSGFRLGEIITSFRTKEDWENRRDKKNSSTYWEYRNGTWFLYIDDFKGTDSAIPVDLKIRSWTKPPTKNTTKVKDKEGGDFYWDTELVEICKLMFRNSPYLFSSPNLRSHRDLHYSKTYYANVFKQRMVNNGDSGLGWENYGVQRSHDLRSYFITYQINSGIPLEDLSLITRHRPSTLWKYYLRYSEQGQLKRQALMKGRDFKKEK